MWFKKCLGRKPRRQDTDDGLPNAIHRLSVTRKPAPTVVNTPIASHLTTPPSSNQNVAASFQGPVARANQFATSYYSPTKSSGKKSTSPEGNLDLNLVFHQLTPSHNNPSPPASISEKRTSLYKPYQTASANQPWTSNNAASKSSSNLSLETSNGQGFAPVMYQYESSYYQPTPPSTAEKSRTLTTSFGPGHPFNAPTTTQHVPGEPSSDQQSTTAIPTPPPKIALPSVSYGTQGIPSVITPQNASSSSHAYEAQEVNHPPSSSNLSSPSPSILSRPPPSTFPFQVRKRIPHFPLDPRPPCPVCGTIPSGPKETRPTNENGNAGRPRLVCDECRKDPLNIRNTRTSRRKGWITWDDDLGVHPDNPVCECPGNWVSRQDRSGKRSKYKDGGFWTCATGQCDYLSYRLDGVAKWKSQTWDPGFEPWLLQQE
ncbi:MAG: hypothetical protein Q9218_003467 [Villophora microphyllina]